MDSFDSKDFYGFSLSDDPKLRTTTRNYEFKFNSSDHLERIINRVKMDRERSKQRELLARSYMHPSFRESSAPFSKAESSLLPKATRNVETEISRSGSRNTVVKVMTSEEIEAMISQAFISTDGIQVTNENSSTFLGSIQDEVTPPNENVQPTSTDLRRLEAKVPMASVEMLSDLQPHWVEITPTQKESRSYTQETTQSDSGSALNLADGNLDDLNTEVNEDKLSDIVSFDSCMSEDFVLRNNEPLIEAESPPGSLISLGIESPLNRCERAEMERILGTAFPHIPEMKFDNLDSQEDSELSEYPDDQEQDDEEVNDETICQENIEQHVQPVIRIKQLKRHPTPPTVESPRSSVTQTAISSRPAPKTMTMPKPQSSKERPPETPVEKKVKKQIEVLKLEKMRIYSKITSIQEKIIEILDKLRMNLLELSLPDGNVEQRLRERNALEFSVRFSRNYLFPLGSMIEDLRASPKDNFCSATTNEPCVKVCGIYGLLSQALECYHKQLRHFFTDSVPKKLDVLIEMINDATNLCLNKKIFEKEDTVIQCLLLRCSSFLEFVIKFAEEKKTAREEVISVRTARRDQLRPAKWDLAMNLNSLNMYEPKLVAKKPKKTPKKTPKTTMQSFSSRATLKSRKIDKPPKGDDKVMLPAPDPVDTQVRKLGNTESLQQLHAVVDEEPEDELTKSAIKTLQGITKDEFGQILAPLVSNLTSSDTRETGESVLDVLKAQLLARCKQLNIDAAATENITQNGNTYQKEVTKKGADSSTENRQRRVSKTKAASSSNNVKEGSTEQTKRYNSCGGRTDTICDKQSLSNIDVVAVVDENGSMKQKTRSRSNVVAGGGAFLSAAAAYKPTPAIATNRIGIPPPSLAIAVSPVQLDEVMPSLPVQQSKWMTSQCLEHSGTLPVVELPMADGFTPKAQRIGDEDEEYRKEIGPQRKVRDGDDNDTDNANAFDKPEENQEARRRTPPPASSSSAKNGTAMSGQMEHLNYSRNVIYTFVKYGEDNQQMPEVKYDIKEIENDNIPPEKIPRSATPSPKHLQNSNLKSVESDEKLIDDVPIQLEEQRASDQDIKELLEQRKMFIEQCKNNPLYANPQFPQPWKILSKISNSIAREIVRNVEEELSFGEKTYVQDFINMELQS